MPAFLTRLSFATAVLLASVLVHLGLLGVMVLAERNALAPSQTQTIDVELVKPQELEEASKPEPPKPEPLKPEPPKTEAKAEPPKPEPPTQAEQPLPQPSPPPLSAQQAPAKMAKAEPQLPPEKPQERPAGPSGGPPSESKSKLTPEEIAALRAQVQKCWQLPVGIPGILGLELVIRVSFGQRGQIAGEPVLLKAPASEKGPLLVGIAMTALKECSPYRMPASKYADWKVLDLRFLATGMTGLGVVERPAQVRR